MKQLKMNPTKLIAMSVMTFALSSCFPEIIEKVTYPSSITSVFAEYTAGYKVDGGKLKEIIAPTRVSTFDVSFSETQPFSSLILDQRRSDRTTNWNFKFAKQFTNAINLPAGISASFYKSSDSHYIISSEPTTPALYNELCADTWDEPVTNGELSKAWKLATMAEGNGNPTYEDDMMKFSAFDNKFTYKPGKLRSVGFNKIVNSDKKEVFATFTIGEEVLPDSLYLNNNGISASNLSFVISLYTKQGVKVSFVNIEYSNGKDTYSLKLYKLATRTGGIMIYMVSNDGLGSLQALVPVPDLEYANYDK